MKARTMIPCAARSRLLVARTNKPEYWSQLLSTAQGTKGLSDHRRWTSIVSSC